MLGLFGGPLAHYAEHTTFRRSRLPTWSSIAIRSLSARASRAEIARRLSARGLDVMVLEASDGIGGRVRTDEVCGFRLDRGFQVLLTAYPEAQASLDYGR